MLYLAAEDGTGMTMRVRALHDRMGNAPNFFLQPVPVDFLNSDSPHISQVSRHIDQIQPGLIILDTISRAFPGLRENDPDEMGRVVQVGARGSPPSAAAPFFRCTIRPRIASPHAGIAS